MILLAALFSIALLTLFSISRLEIVINGDSIYYRMFPFNIKMKRLRVGDIAEYEIREYSPIKEYGGWGIRWGLAAKGMAYNISGKTGLQIKTKNNKHILIGTQRPDDLKNAVDKLFEQNSNK
jgi:hypothetical protein